uniref:Uncharacterized protein n=1 Tax=Glossina palpalis gambiensis TaxID=67801 RepID=A0A1B0BP85_9MUSC
NHNFASTSVFIPSTALHDLKKTYVPKSCYFVGYDSDSRSQITKSIAMPTKPMITTSSINTSQTMIATNSIYSPIVFNITIVLGKSRENVRHVTLYVIRHTGKKQSNCGTVQSIQCHQRNSIIEYNYMVYRLIVVDQLKFTSILVLVDMKVGIGLSKRQAFQTVNACH